MKKKTKSIKFIFPGVLFVLLCLLLNISVKAAENTPEVIETHTNIDIPSVTWYVRGISGKPESLNAYMGTEEINVSESGVLGDDGGYAPKTLVLIDNSRSISKYKNEIKDILVRLIWNHQNSEQFAIATFDKETRFLVDYTDNYDELRVAAENITYKDQYTYLRNVVSNEIIALANDEDNYCSRIILISDGTDDSILGTTYEELTDLAKNDTTFCPIYTIGCSYKPSETGLDKLFALSRLTNTPYFLMSDYENATDIADVIDNDGKQIRYFSLELDPDQIDGSEKAISLIVKDSNGEHLITHVSRLQLASPDALRDLIKDKNDPAEGADSEADDTYLNENNEDNADNADSEDMQADEGSDEPGEAETLQDERTKELSNRIEHPESVFEYAMYYLSQSGVWIMLFLLLGLAAFTRFAGAERKKSRNDFIENDDPDEVQRTLGVQEKITKGIVLTDINDAGVRYSIGIGSDFVIGRLRSRCDIAFPKDRSMSARCAILHVSVEGVRLENLDTQRGSIVDGETITDSVELKNGSRIRLGSTDLRVTYE